MKDEQSVNTIGVAIEVTQVDSIDKMDVEGVTQINVDGRFLNVFSVVKDRSTIIQTDSKEYFMVDTEALVRAVCYSRYGRAIHLPLNYGEGFKRLPNVENVEREAFTGGSWEPLKPTDNDNGPSDEEIEEAEIERRIEIAEDNAAEAASEQKLGLKEISEQVLKASFPDSPDREETNGDN